ncbi:MAG: hypothetical protein ACRDGB_05125 [Candidatus Limnocylindria bacterium]
MAQEWARAARRSRIAATIGRDPELGPVARDPGVLILSWSEAMDAARAILAGNP